MTMITSLSKKNALAKSIQAELNVKWCDITLRRFPDEESYVRVDSDVKGQSIVIVESLNQPDEKILSLLFLAKTLKELGAKSVGLVAPYLSYMRQDKRFTPGEAISSRIFAELMSGYFDFLMTVDPHLHRHPDLDGIYTIPTTVLHARDSITQWVGENIKNPTLVGPDSESRQWIEPIAKKLNSQYFVLNKIRHGDRDVEVEADDVKDIQGRALILLDDIISTAGTMIKSVQYLKKQNPEQIVCIGVHAIFSGNSYKELLAAGADKVITCNTISHESNVIDLTALIAKELVDLD